MKLLALLVALFGASFACKDKWGPSCNSVQRWCKTNSAVQRHCQKTCNLCHLTTQPPTQPPTVFPGSCGLRQVSSGKVVGGTTAKRGDWPWQILLQKYNRGLCGGTIINQRYVVTAAHCISKNVKNPSDYSVVIGETDRWKDEGSEQTIKAENITVHSKYSPYILDNDIALIKLESDIPFGKYVQPACLPKSDITPGHKDCFITGWGKMIHPGRMVSKLQQARMPPVRNYVCYQKNKKVINIFVSRAMVCAGEGGINPISGCHGDSGGPYVCEVDGRWELTGAVSWGSRRCNSKETYTVFARINYFKQWIIDTITKNGM